MEDKQERELQDRIGATFGERYREAGIGKIIFPSTVEGTGNRLIDWLKKPKNFLILTGKPGSGKTYFCAAVFAFLYEKIKFMRAYHERNLLDILRQTISQGGEYLTQLKSMIDDEIIIIDDIGSSGHTDWREEILMELVDYRYSRKLPTIFTSNFSKDEFYQTYNKRIGSRLFAKENLILTSPDVDYREEGL